MKTKDKHSHRLKESIGVLWISELRIRRAFIELSVETMSHFVWTCGCGKTFLATHYALKNLAQGKYENMVITKPLVEVDGEKMGYLPGDIDEKTAPYMMSLYYNMEQIIGKQRLDVLRSMEL